MSRISDLAGFTTAISTTEDLSVGIITASSFSGNLTGDVTGTASLASNLAGTPDITLNNLTGAAATFSGNVTIGGTLTYQDVENIDSVGIITAQQGIQVLANGLDITGVSTFNDNIDLQDNDKIILGTGDDLQIYHDGGNSNIHDTGTGSLILKGTNLDLQANNGDIYIRCVEDAGTDLRHNNTTRLETADGGVVITGVCTATSFSGSGENLTNLPASGDSNDITASLFI